jgi:hypothetical protein
VLRDNIGSAERNLRYELIDLWFSKSERRVRLAEFRRGYTRPMGVDLAETFVL